MKQGFWTVRTMALIGAILFGAYGLFSVQEQWSLGGDYAARAIGHLVAYLVVGAIFGAVLAWFLPAEK